MTKPHPDLLAAQALAYAPCGYHYEELQPEAESVDYAACTLLLNNLRCCFRVAKITPTKVGQFVTLWKRLGRGPIQPFDAGDPVDLFVVSTRSGQHLGQFVFPKAVLAAQGVVASGDGTGHHAVQKSIGLLTVLVGSNRPPQQVWVCRELVCRVGLEFVFHQHIIFLRHIPHGP